MKIIFFVLTFLGSVSLLVASHLSGASVVTSVAFANETWVSLLFTFGLATTIISLFFIGYEIAAAIHRKPPVVVTKNVPAAPTSLGSIPNGVYPPIDATPILKAPDTILTK